MEGVPSPVSSRIIAGEDSNSHFLSSDLTDISGHAVIFSYAPPDMVRQAKLEAMEMKVRRKMLERKASLLDTHALSDLNMTQPASAAVRVSARSGAVGSRELVKSLVVPPSLTEHGEEVRGSSEFILDGERLEYQRPGRVAPDASQAARPMPHFRTYEPVNRTSTNGSAKKTPWGVAEGGSAGRKTGARSSGSGSYGAALDGSGKGTGRDRMGRQELKAQLSDGMMSYVPSKFQRPKGVESTAFVPQGQAMEEARHNYETGRQRRPASAPPRRAAAAAAAAKGADGEEGSGKTVGAGGAAAARSGGAMTGGATSGRAAADGAPGIVGPRSKKWMDVPVVVAEETDLFAMYRQKSQQQQHTTIARSSSDRLRGASARSLAGAKEVGTTALAPSGQGAGGGSRPAAAAAGVGAAGARGQFSLPNSRKSIVSPPELSAPGPRQVDAIARVRPRPASSAPTGSVGAAKGSYGGPAGASSATPKREPTRRPNPAGRPKVPATAAEAAAMAAAAAGRPWSARISSVWEAPRPPSPSKIPGSSRPPSQRRISAPAGTGAAAAGAGAAGGSGSSTSADGNGAARSVWQPVDPETRLQRQTRPGSAINTAKTNRARGSSARINGGGERGAAQPAWTTSTSAAGRASCDRTQLQERILGGLIRQYTLGEDEEDSQAAAAAASPAVEAGTVVIPPRRPVRPRATDSAAAGGGLLAAQRSGLGVGVGSVQTEPQQIYGHAGRPQSAPNRRLRPPSPGHWAGRPDPDTLPSRAAALQHTTTGILYDPELQPGPLDSYINQLNGLD